MRTIIVIMAVVFMRLSVASAADYYSVVLDAPSKTITETAWQQTQTPTAWAPHSMEHILTRGVVLTLPNGELALELTWEMDLGILQGDGNITHLLGTASVSEIVVKANTTFAVITADLTGVQTTECRARLSASVDVRTRVVWTEKLFFNCLGREVEVVTARHLKE